MDIANQIVSEEKTKDNDEDLITHTLRSSVCEILVQNFAIEITQGTCKKKCSNHEMHSIF